MKLIFMPLFFENLKLSFKKQCFSFLKSFLTGFIITSTKIAPL